MAETSVKSGGGKHCLVAACSSSLSVLDSLPLPFLEGLICPASSWHFHSTPLGHLTCVPQIPQGQMLLKNASVPQPVA